MTDKNGNEVIPVIPSEVLDKVSVIRNSKSVRIFLYVCSNIMADQHKMCAELSIKQNYSELERGYNELYRRNLVMRYIDDNRNIVYTLHPLFVSEHLKCNACTYSRRKIIRTDKRNMKYFACGATFNCTYNYFRVVLTVFRQYRLLKGLEPHENSGSVKKRSIEETERKLSENVEEWGSDHFATFIIQQYKERYEHMDNPSRPAIRATVAKMRKILSAEFPEKWRQLLKYYIIHEFDRAVKEKRYLIHKYLTGIKGLLDYANKDHTFDMEKCGKYEIFCPYWKCDGCALKKAQGKCNKELRRKFEKAFN